MVQTVIFDGANSSTQTRYELLLYTGIYVNSFVNLDSFP